ncbi:MAG TPA: MFS transporter [Gemmatimonadales bacterium]|nr:MFS transporter [Gemmatimonadales bacterium]
MRISNPRILVAVCLGYFMAVLDSTVVNVALPDMAHSLGTGISGMQWVVDGYALLFASLLLPAGALGDRWGNRGTFALGLALFTVSSVLCGIAPSLSSLIVFRGIQGIGAAIQVPASLALLRNHYHDQKERAYAIGIWAAATGLAVAAGPVVGGVLTHAFGWRSVFLVNLPIGIGGVYLTLKHVPPVPRTPVDADIGTQLLAVTALAAVTFALIQGGPWGWTSPAVLGAGALAVVTGALWLRAERRAVHPLLPLDLFQNPTYSAANAVGFALSFGFYGQLFLMSLFFQNIQHFSALKAGLAILPQTLVMSGVNFASGRLTARYGARVPLVWGLSIGGVGLLGLGQLTATSALTVAVLPMLAVGVGSALTMPAMTATAIEHTPKERAGIGAAVLNAARQVGGVFGIALLGAFVAGTHFMGGFPWGMRLAGALYLGAGVLSWTSVEREAKSLKHVQRV